MSSPFSLQADQGAGPLMRASAPDPCVALLFGITGDLAQRKLVPALFHLESTGALPENFAVVGLSRSAGDVEALRRKLGEALERHSPNAPIDRDAWERFSARITGISGNLEEGQTYERLGAHLSEVDQARGTLGNRLVYLSTPPSAFPTALTQLKQAGIVRHAVEAGSALPWTRVVIEKPFGHDLASARTLNQQALEVLGEEHIYRIDHYLGKETVQNIFVMRFGNAIFEPLWNRQHIDHVQITMAETIGVVGRGRFYEETGVLRDIVQNHLLQVLALCAMEPPVSFEADEIRNMKAQVLRSLRPMPNGSEEGSIVWGQYEGYRDEAGVAENSKTPTFVAMRAHIDNWRWNGVPFYLRAGKALKSRVTEVSFHFKSIPFCLFGDEQTCQMIDPNVLKLRIQPNEGISMQIACKVPGEDLSIGGVTMDFQYEGAFGRKPPEAYERLLLDCMRGDATLFARRDEVEYSWAFSGQIQEALERRGMAPEVYALGSEGPAAARELLRRDGRRWVNMG